jgi:two-component system sensor histidine kinase RegB
MERGGLAPKIVAEETLSQAFANLIDNAVRASPHHVEVRADWSGLDLVVAVCDSGPGFPGEVLGNLGQTMPTVKGLDAGIGVGLLLTNVTLGRLGGSLSLQNQPEGGACAEVRLPLRAILFEETASAADHRVAN